MESNTHATNSCLILQRISCKIIKKCPCLELDVKSIYYNTVSPPFDSITSLSKPLIIFISLQWLSLSLHTSTYILIILLTNIDSVLISPDERPY